MKDDLSNCLAAYTVESSRPEDSLARAKAQGISSQAAEL
jgi:hypothetical protein